VIEEMALNYFRGLNRSEKKKLIKRLFDSMTEEEKVDLAKILLGKK